MKVYIVISTPLNPKFEPVFKVEGVFKSEQAAIDHAEAVYDQINNVYQFYSVFVEEGAVQE